MEYYFTMSESQKKAIIRQNKDRFTTAQKRLIRQMGKFLEERLGVK